MRLIKQVKETAQMCWQGSKRHDGHIESIVYIWGCDCEALPFSAVFILVILGCPPLFNNSHIFIVSKININAKFRVVKKVIGNAENEVPGSLEGAWGD